MRFGWLTHAAQPRPSLPKSSSILIHKTDRDSLQKPDRESRRLSRVLISTPDDPQPKASAPAPCRALPRAAHHTALANPHQLANARRSMQGGG